MRTGTCYFIISTSRYAHTGRIHRSSALAVAHLPVTAPADAAGDQAASAFSPMKGRPALQHNLAAPQEVPTWARPPVMAVPPMMAEPMAFSS